LHFIWHRFAFLLEKAAWMKYAVFPLKTKLMVC